jgi:hypothetical protein
MQSLSPLQHRTVKRVSDLIQTISIYRPGKIAAIVADALACMLWEEGLIVSDDQPREEPNKRLLEVLTHPACGVATAMKLMACQAYGIDPQSVIDQFLTYEGRNGQ